MPCCRRRLRLAFVLLAVPCIDGACRGEAGKPLGPPDSYALFAATDRDLDGLPVVARVDIDDARAVPLVRIFEDGFGSEMVRTAYIAKQLVREGSVEGRRLAGASGSAATESLPVVVGLDRAPWGRGLALGARLGAPARRPELVWLGFGESIHVDKALVQTVTGRLALYVAHLIATGGTFAESPPPPAPLVDGYRMAMEVIAREWRVGKGPAGVVPYDAGLASQRKLFADVRENRFVLAGEEGVAVRPAAELLASAGVAATVVYRLAQTRGVAHRPAPDRFYAPFAPGRLPPGVSPAAVLGPFRNFQAKLLAVWGKAVAAGRPPRDIVDLLDLYGRELPDERAELVRIFVVTTFGATVKAGGASPRPQDSAATLAELERLTSDVLSGRRTLRDAP